MRFAEPLYAAVLLLPPLLVWLAHRARRLRAAGLRRLIGSGAASHGRRLTSTWLVCAAIAVLALAAMRPQWGLRDEDVARRGRDVAIVLDVSLSMLAADAVNESGATRLGRARTGIVALVERLRGTGGHRLALVTFAGRATLLSPLSVDYDLFLTRLALADPRKAPGPGTRLEAAVAKTLDALGEEAAGFTDIVLVSDGEDFGEGLDGVADLVREAGVRLHAVGVGDASRDVVLSVPGTDGRQVTIEYRGRPVRTRMQPETLRALVSAAGDGEFLDAGNGPVALDAWFERAVAHAPRRVLTEAAEAQPAERYALLVVLALLLLGAEAVVALRERRAARPALAAAAAGTAALLVSGFSFLEPSSQAMADGAAAFHAGRFAEARYHYEQALALEPESDTVAFNLGAARYRTRDLAGALEAYGLVEDGSLAARARHGEGVVHYQRAIARLQAADEAARALRAALDAFRAALDLDPALDDARFNLALGLLLMTELEAVERRPSGADREPDATGESGEPPADGHGEEETEPQAGAGSGSAGQDSSGLPGKPAEGTGGQAAMSGQGQRGQRAEQLTRDDAEQLVNRVRLDTRAAIDDADSLRLRRMAAGATGPFW